MKIIDIHTHILFGVDDGARSIEESIKMCQTEVENFVTDAICTPHMRLGVYTPEQQKILDAFNQLKLELKQKNIPLNLHLGREFYHNESYVRKKQYDIKYTLCDKKTILLELPNQEIDVCEICYGYIIRGYQVILAHVERYNILQQDIIELRQMGVKIQVNATSLVGKFFKVCRRAKQLVKNNYVDFIASDYHFVRKNNLKKAYTFVEKRYGKESAENLFYNNAKQLIY